ncbi:HCaRG family protein [Burkholderia gladioli]|uniref:hypothetical protein n=1 Tax=Burkholderia gladioli TaxID=28095 RepID=UPI001CAE798E|nr:hypothetical protein [Burkholderia gladioli]CAG9193406.1 HCaRG family protein [Burkholderia gladioli]
MADLLSEQQLSDFLRSLPRGAIPSVREGFVQLQSLRPEAIDGILEAGQASISGTPTSLERIAALIGVSERVADLMMAAVSMTMYASARYEAALTVDQLVKILKDVDLLTVYPSDELKALFAAIVKHHGDLRDTVERNDETRSSLPSLTNLTLDVNVRIAFQKNDVKSLVPVVIGHINTDAEGQLVWFQLTKEQLLSIHESIGDTLKQIESVEATLSKLRG